ncbi:MAG: hypothetical protein AAB557_03465 [Patescibacteria group bacterium]
MAERLHLMHGTADVIIPAVIAHAEPLYGYVIPESQQYSGTLTDSFEKARAFADKLIWHDEARAVVLHYLLPPDILISHGPIGTDDAAHSWSTNLIVARARLPQAYRDGIMLDDSTADHTGWEFFEVPTEFLDDVEYLPDQSPLAGLLYP